MQLPAWSEKKFHAKLAKDAKLNLNVSFNFFLPLRP